MFAESSPLKSKINWPLRFLLFIVLLQLSSLVSLAFNDIQAIDAMIKSKISTLVDIENIGQVQSVQTNQIGPFTFFKFNFFAIDKHQVSAKATQVLGFSPYITCVSGSKNHRCQ